jgi:hypothetical protein
VRTASDRCGSAPAPRTRVPGRAVCGGADRSRRGQNDARADAARVGRPRPGERTFNVDPAAAEQALIDAETAGIDLNAVTKLEREGVRSRWESYHRLLGCIESKLGVVVSA